MTQYLGKRFPKNLLPSIRFTMSWEPDVAGCWNWQGKLSPGGYGRIGVDGKTLRAHRYSWMLTNGDIPEGMVVCHSCDNPRCVNPTHLFLGSIADNVADCVGKGRNARGEKLAHPRARGEHNGNSRLTAQQVNAIISDERSQRVIARQFGVSQAAISKIKRGEMWK